MAKARETGATEVAVGLCSNCTHAARQKGGRGSAFWRCLRADDDPTYRRYPPLPVQACAGHEAHPPDSDPERDGGCVGSPASRKPT